MVFGRLGCFFGVHDYKIIRTGPFDFMHKGRVVGESVYYDLQCKICGDVKRRVMKP
ncbi:hypothetical protein Arefeen1_00072 [Pseudomonas phage Arefeen1]|nr:hypothetical protein oldone_11 [Pseudomonas phage oldone]UYE90140.1 hypothetical protein [Pseudomonas phage PaeP_Ls]WMS59559.1 hypothetical protein Arefeen1_00072 [Pseudomonas phage Arefeen1]